jgi:antitoxin PrlF
MITSKLTSKAQTTIPRPVREALGVRPGDEIAYAIEHGSIVVTKAGARGLEDTATPFSQGGAEDRLRQFDAATLRQAQREIKRKTPSPPKEGRGWTRAELYARGRPR